MLSQRWFGIRHAIGIALVGSLVWSAPCSAQTLGLQPVASGFTNPVGAVNARDGSMRLFVVEQAGTIRIYNGVQVLPTPFLNITAKVLSGGERGLLGLAFDPSYATNGFFYVYYTSQPSGQVTIARYSVSPDPNAANPNSELILKTQVHATFNNHNGGSLVFGPDGCLYAGIGDGGSGGDPNNNGQNLGTLLGKIIRISPSDGSPCAAAPGNPFVSTPGALGEIWALGVRNPWRITFDRQTGDLLIADVGQDTREEVDFQPPGIAGRNYCWRRKEGTFIFDASVPCTAGIPTDPIFEYGHTAGNCAITGGYRYRGSQFPALTGTYFYADLCTGRLSGATESGGTWTTSELLATGRTISSFGEDEQGEVYVVDLSNGAILRLVVTQTLQVSPASNMAAFGRQGGPFSPSSASYSVSATTGSVAYSISIQFEPGVPSWLTLSGAAATGTATTSPQSATFTVNGSANALTPGTYAATIAFTNTTNNQGTTTRTETLTVVATGQTSDDNFINAATIHLNETKTANNAGASKETGEPNHAGNAGGKSLWWNFLAPSNVAVKISTAGSSFDTLLAVYTGNAVNALALVASNDNTAGVTSEVTFNASANTLYRIAVDGKNGASGNIQLAVTDNSSPGATWIVAAVSPNARTTTVNGTVTAFASIINGGSVTATACLIALPAGYPGTLQYQRTNPANNQPVGSPNTPADVPAGQAQTFVFSVTPTAVTSQEIPLVFDCTNTNPATVNPGLNTFLVSASNTAIPDMLSVAATQAGGGIMDLSNPNSASVVATASIDIGAGGTVTVVGTDTAVGQLPSNLPLTITICQTDPSDGHCINPTSPGASSTVTVANNETVYFTAFVAGQGQFITFDPANNRVLVIAYAGSTPVGEASAAVRMLSGGP
jgi:glucose/arabinose dehydrogenase